MGNGELKMDKMLNDFVIKTNKTFANDVDRYMSIVNNLDKQILDLIEQRNSTLFTLNCKCLKHKNARQCLSTDPLTIDKEYTKFGFKSDIVKHAVANIRSIFFDDTQEKFHKFNCTQIIYREYGDDSNYIKFEFEDDDGHSFMLTFDIKQDEHKELYSQKFINGYIFFSVKIGRDYHTIDYTIERSVDVLALKSAIERWIDNGFDAKKFNFGDNNLVENINEIFGSFEYSHLRYDDF